MTGRNLLRLSLTGLAFIGLTACLGEEEPAHLGYVEAEWTYVSAPAAGRITEMQAKEGETVEAGMLLFRLDSTAEEAALAEAEAQVRQAAAQAENLETGARRPEVQQLRARLDEAQARLNRALKDRDRILPLVEQGLEPQSRADAAESEVEAAQAAVRSAREAIDVATLPGRPAEQAAAGSAAISAEARKRAAEYRLEERSSQAPEGGRVEEIFYRVGEYVTPGQPVVSILPPGGLKVRFFVPEAELPQISIGRTVRVKADGLDSPVEATVSFISHEAEFTPPVIYSRNTRGKLVFLIEADLPQQTGFHPGLPVEVDW